MVEARTTRDFLVKRDKVKNESSLSDQDNASVSLIFSFSPLAPNIMNPLLTYYRSNNGETKATNSFIQRNSQTFPFCYYYSRLLPKFTLISPYPLLSTLHKGFELCIIIPLAYILHYFAF